MSKRNGLSLSLGGFENLITQLDELGGDIEAVVTDALTQAGETIGDDTFKAMAKANLPAGGKYSREDTIKSVIRQPKVEWNGTVAEIGVGFDKTKSGVGSLLITGTPKMPPDAALEKIFGRKKYQKQINDDISAVISAAIDEKLGG